MEWTEFEPATFFYSYIYTNWKWNYMQNSCYVASIYPWISHLCFWYHMRLLVLIHLFGHIIVDDEVLDLLPKRILSSDVKAKINELVCYSWMSQTPSSGFVLRQSHKWSWPPMDLSQTCLRKIRWWSTSGGCQWLLEMAELISDDDDETLLILSISTIIFSSCTFLCYWWLKKKASFACVWDCIEYGAYNCLMRDLDGSTCQR